MLSPHHARSQKTRAHEVNRGLLQQDNGFPDYGRK